MDHTSLEFYEVLEDHIDNVIYELMEVQGDDPIPTEVSDKLVMIKRAVPKLTYLTLTSLLKVPISSSLSDQELADKVATLFFNQLKISASEYIEMLQTVQLNSAMSDLNLDFE